ncbi:hypothetical protein ACQ4PT_006642 [Festuca glaucescens]
MAGLEDLKRRLQPIFFDADGNVVPPPDSADAASEDTCDCDDPEKVIEYTNAHILFFFIKVLDGATINLLSKSSDEYNINELGFHKRTTRQDDAYSTDKAYQCSFHDMHIFDPVGNGASSVVHRAIYVPVHRVLALKKINIFEKEKRQQIINEIRTLTEASCYPGLVEFQGVFYAPDSGEIYFALEYMDGGSLADIIRVKKFIPEPVLSHMLQKVLLALRYLHEVRRLVHRDIKPANLLLNLKGDTKITDFGVTAGLHDSITKCATFLGSVTYMSPERIRNENYSYAADIWSLGLTTLECATGRYPYDVSGGEADLMLQILEDPSPTPPRDIYSEEFFSFIDACLQKDADARPTCDQLLSHSFIKKYEGPGVDLAEYNKSVHDPSERLSQIAHMLAVHYYLIFDGGDDQWRHMKSFYERYSVFSFSGETHVGKNEIFDTLSRIRTMLKGNSPCEKIAHVVEKVYCCAHGEEGMSVQVSGSFIVGNEFPVCADGFRAEGMPSMEELSPDILSNQAGHFQEDFFLEPGTAMGCYIIAKQELHIAET